MTLGHYEAASFPVAAVDIQRERRRQDDKWGRDRTLPSFPPFGRCDGAADRPYAMGFQHNEQAIKATMTWEAQAGDASWGRILQEEVIEAFAAEDTAQLRAELVQVAAVAQAWIEAIDDYRTTLNQQPQERV